MVALKRYWLTMIFAAGIVYFGVHGLVGEQGALAWAGHQRRIERLEAGLEILYAQRAALEARAARLRPATLDRDFLDERARALLNVAHPRDLVIPAAALPPGVGVRPVSATTR